MDVSGTHTFAAPRERVWSVLLDPTALRASLPSTKEFRQVGDDEAVPDDEEYVMARGVFVGAELEERLQRLPRV